MADITKAIEKLRMLKVRVHWPWDLIGGRQDYEAALDKSPLRKPKEVPSPDPLNPPGCNCPLEDQAINRHHKLCPMFKGNRNAP